MKQFYKILFFTIFLSSNSYSSPSNLKRTSSNLERLAAPSATIAGTTTVCQNAASPLITFTGSGGTAPYTFTYKINGGTNQTVTTTGTNSSIIVSVPTGTAVTFTYLLVSVHDATLPITEQTITGQTAVVNINPQADASLNSTAVADTFNGFPVFKICSNQPTQIDFFNTSTTLSTNTNYTINWGDTSANFNSSSNWNTVSHNYAVGLWTLTYSITALNGCNVTKIYKVFVGNNPAVGFGNPGNTDVCISSPLTFPITGTANNPPGTTYTVTFNDGSLPIVFNHPPPSDVTHLFLINSCNVTSTVGSSFQNSFYASIVAENPCDRSSATVVPIRISTPPVANFTLPQTIKCTNSQICFTNTSTGGDSASSTSCSTPKIIWTITPNTGFALVSGNLGNDFGSTNTNAWTSGSSSICPTFSIPGNYIITMKIGNRCGIDQITKTICIEPPLVSQFNLSPNTGCIPFTVTATNTTSLVNQCGTPTYQWTVSYAAGFCGTTSAFTYTGGTSATSASPLFNFTEAGTYSIKVTMTNSCGSVTSAIQTITVKKPPTASIATIPNSCGSANITPIATINSCAPTSSTLTYAWSFPGGTPSSSTALNPGTINYPAGGPYTVSLIATNECGPSNTATQTFTVNIAPLITNTSLSQTICSGSTTSLVNLTANPTGTTFSWTATATAGISGFTPSGTTNTIPTQTITTTNPSPGTVTYVITPSVGGCPGPPVNYVITVNPAPAITTQPASSAVCLGGTPTPLTVALNSSSITPTYQWYSNTASSTTGGTLIPGATNATYNPPATTAGTLYYYCIISLSSGGCSGLTSAVATVTINPLPTITTQPPATQSICVGGTIAALTVAYTGGLGTATYQWFSNTSNATTGGIAITGATSNSYTPPAFTLPGVYYYYCIVSLSGSGCGAVTSLVATINVSADPTVSVQPLPTQTLCQGATPTSLQVTATGGNGAFSYQWYINSNATTPSGTAIATATSSTYSPPTNVVGTQYYYCEITQNTPGCGVTSAISTVVINTSPSIQNQPVSSTICLGGTPTQMSVTYINGVGTPSYQWYSNTNDNTTSGTIIPGANGSTYSPPNTTIGTIYYYCIITLPSAGGCSNIVSNTAFVTINGLPIIDTQPLSAQDVCVGATLQTPLTVVYSGGTGTASYQWFSNTINSSTGGTAITGAINSSFIPATFTTVGNKYFYVVVTLSGSGCGAATSSVATINVLADPTVSAQPLSTQTLCQGATPTSLQVTATGGNGAFSYQWYINSNATTPSGTAIATATSSTYTPPTTTVGTQYYYCEITQVTPGCGVTSAISTVVINTSPSIQNQPVSSTICLGGTPTQMSVTFINGVGTPSYQWYSNATDNTTSGTTIPGANGSTYSPPNTPIGTIYYYCIITLPSAGGCSNIISNTAFVTINGLPIIDTQPLSTQDVCVGATIQTPLTVVYSGGTGTASYQWFSNTINSSTGGTAITGAINSSFIPATFTTVGNKYFYVVVTLSGSGCGAATSSVATINVLADPTISAQPLQTQTLCQGTIPTALTVSATGGIGNFTYQWFSNSPPNTLILGATNDTYIPDTNVTGTTSYYCVVSQTGLGCQVTSNNAEVVVVPAPVINNQPQSSSICVGGSPSSLSVTYLNGTGTASYQWYDSNGPISGATNLTYSPVLTSTTSYYCIVTFSSGGCTSITSDTAIVTVEPLPTIDVQPLSTQNLCVGGTIAPLSISYINGAGTPTYQWFSSPSNSTSGGTAVGTNSANYTPPVFSASGTYYYYATVTLSGNGCGIVSSNSAEVVVVADPVLTTQPIPTQTICQGITPVSLTVSGTGGLGSFSYQWYSNSPPNSIISGATTDTYVPDTTTTGTTNYYCVVSQPGIGCEVISNLSQVIVVPAPLITTQPQNRSVCEGQSVAPITVAYINGAGNVTYQWFSNSSNSNSGGTSIAGANANSFTPPSISVGTVYYYCEITFSSGGCTLISTNTAEVNIFQIPVISTQNVVACSGDAFNFIPQIGGANVIPANTQYTWNLISINPLNSVTGATSESTPQNGLNQTLINNTNQVATVTYSVTPISGICTGNPFTVEVLVYPKPSVVFDLANQTICNGTNTSLVTLSSLTPGTISFSWTASVPPGITGAILSGTDTIPVQNLMNSSPIPLTVDYTAIGTFNYNGSGCNGPSSIYSITVNPTLLSSGTISSYNGYGVSFFGATDGFIDLTVTGGSGVYTYTWTGPNGFTASTEDLNGVAAGTYTVSINDGYCAPTVLTFILTQPPELLFQEDTSVHVNLVCFGDSNGVLGIIITQESVPPYDFQLINSNGIVVNTILSSTTLNQSFTGLVADTYSVKIIDANGGVKILNGLIVTQPNDIVITATTTPITCYGANNASITLTVTGGTGPYEAVWDNLATGFYQNNLSAGTYTILVTDSNNCTKPISVFIPEALLFTVNPVVRNITCFGANDGSINLNFVGGIPAISLVWSDGSTAGTTRNNLGPGTYSVTIIDGTPCTIFRTFTIVEPQPLIVTASLTNAFDCLNPNSGAINLIVSGGTPPYSYNWSNGSTTEDLLSITSGNYQVTVTDLNGCTNTKQYSIIRPEPLQINVSTQTTFDCETHYVNQTFVANVVGGVPAYQLQWSSGTISGVNNEIMQTNVNGTVVLEVTDNIGCQSNYTVNVDTPVLGYASFNQSSFGFATYGIYAIGDPIQFTNTATGDFVSVLWDFGDGTFSTELNPIHTYTIAKDYIVTLTVTYPFGCVYVQTISLFVEEGYVLVVPTAFTPNNDTLNDTMRPVTRRLKNVQMDIYDTWGSLIYSETGDVLVGWDATIKGFNAENGNYYCKVKGETFYGTTVYSNQTFVLIK